MHSEKQPNDTIAYRLRSDIQWTKIQGRKRDWWIATDPLRSQHFRCSPEERELLNLLNTSRTIGEWRQSYLLKSRGKSIRTDDLQRLLTRFLEYGFLHPQLNQSQLNQSELGSLQPTDALQKTATSLPQKAISVIQWVEQLPWRLIQSRWSLGNPQRFLQAISGRFDLLYDPRAVTAWLYGFIVVIALVMLRLAADADPLAWHPSRWTALTPWVQFGNCVVILMVTRIFHEMGHAIVATRLGAKVRGIGIFWVLGVACPYVDVSDAWLLPSQNKRISVSLAGIYTEMIIATIAAIVWLNTAPGFLNTTCWQTMIVCSAMTIAININPLVRYDGYFALSDYLEVANLRESSTIVLRKLFASGSKYSKLKGNIATHRSSISLSEVGLALFGLASAIYRFVLTFSFAIAAVSIGRMYELDSIGLGVAVSLVVCAFILPVLRGAIVLLSQRSLISFRTVVGYSLLAAITIYAVLIPLPSFVVCDGIVGWSEQKMVYTKESGRLVSVAPILLENATLRYQNQSALEKLTQIQSKVDQARLAMHHDPSAAYPIEKLSLQAAIASETQQQIQSQLDSMQILTVASDHEQTDSETLASFDWRPLELPPPEQIDTTLESGIARTLRSEAGYSVQDESNVGRWLPAGTAIGVLIHGERLRVSATVDEETLSQIQLGTRARFILAAYPTEVRYGRVVSLSDIASLEISQAFSKLDCESVATPTKTEIDRSSPTQSFGILIEMEDNFEKADQTLKLDKSLFGSAASIVLETQSQSILNRVCRYAERVIR